MTRYTPGLIHALVLPAEVAFLQATSNDVTSDTTHTFAGQSIGVAAASRRIIVTIHAEETGAGASTPITSVTIAGVTATIHITERDAGNGDICAIASAAVPTGTTGSIVIVFPNTVRCYIAVYRALFVSNSTPYATANNQDDVVSMSINIPSRGILVAGTSHAITGSITTVGVTEKYDTTINPGGGEEQVAGGCETGMNSESNRTVSFDGATGDAAGVAASWS